MKSQYKNTELGPIPHDWEVKKLGDVLKICHGKTQKDVVSLDGMYPILASGGKIGKASRALYDKPSVLIGRKGTIDQPQYMDTPFWTVDTLFYSAMKNNNDAKFFYYKFCTIPWLKFNEASGVPSLSARTIEKINISCPEPNMQRSIAAVLTDVDTLINKLDQLIIKKQKLKQAIMYQLLKGKTRLDGFNKPWEFKRLDELIIKFPKTNRQSSSGKPEGRYPFFTNSTKHYDKYLDEYDFNLEAIIANTGGEAHFNYFKGFFAVMSDCFVFKSKIETQFLYYLLKLMEQEINDKGFSGSGIKHLDKKYFFDIKLYLPSVIAEQKAIANILSNIDDEMNALQVRRRKTYDIKLAIMQELLTGKTRLLKPKVVNA